MTQVGIHEAKTNFSQLVERTLAGEEIVVTRSGKPVITFVPVQRSHSPRLGFAAGEFEVPDDINELPEWFVAEFEK